MASFMLRVIPGIFLLLGLIVTNQTLAEDPVQQELKRASELLQQLDRADSRKKPSVADGEGQNEHGSNPFSSESTKSVPGSKVPPKVSVDEREIRIEVGGQTLRIDRPKLQPSDGAAQPAPALDIAGSVLQSLNDSSLQQAEIYRQYALSLAEFDKGHYEKAKSLLEQLGDSILNEGLVCQTYALILFQTGEYQKAAEWAYAGLQTVKPFDWNTIRDLYGQPEDYAARYEELQQLSKQEPKRVELHFLLAYHHLMLGHRRHAEAELKSVQNSLGTDPVVQSMFREARNPITEPPQPHSD